MDTEPISNDNQDDAVAGQPDNPEPQIRKGSNSSHSKSRKSSSNSAEEGVRANLHEQLAHQNLDQEEVERLGNKSDTLWTKSTEQQGQQNREEAVKEYPAQAEPANDDARHQEDEQPSNHLWGTGVVELSSNIIVPDDPTEEYQVYGDGSKVIGQPLNDIEHHQQQHAEEVEKTDAHGQPQPAVEPEGQQPNAENHAEEGHHIAEPEVTVDSHQHENQVGNQQPDQVQADNAEEVVPPQHTFNAQPEREDNKKSFDMSLEPEDRRLQVEHHQPQQVHSNVEQPAAPDNHEEAPVVAPRHNSTGPSGITHSTALPKNPVSQDVSYQSKVQHTEQQQEQLLRHEAVEDEPKTTIGIKDSKPPKKERSKGKETEPCKCSVM